MTILFSTPLSSQQIKVVLTLHKTHWENIPHDKYAADAIYHDPFGPRENPEAWSERCFAWQKSHLKDTGRLVTYAAASHVRRAMQTSGLVVAGTDFGGKREMTVAAKTMLVSRNVIVENETVWRTAMNDFDIVIVGGGLAVCCAPGLYCVLVSMVHALH